VSGKWRVESGEWKEESGKRRVERGELKEESGKRIPKNATEREMYIYAGETVYIYIFRPAVSAFKKAGRF